MVTALMFFICFLDSLIVQVNYYFVISFRKIVQYITPEVQIKHK